MEDLPRAYHSQLDARNPRTTWSKRTKAICWSGLFALCISLAMPYLDVGFFLQFLLHMSAIWSGSAALYNYFERNMWKIGSICLFSVFYICLAIKPLTKQWIKDYGKPQTQAIPKPTPKDEVKPAEPVKSVPRKTEPNAELHRIIIANVKREIFVNDTLADHIIKNADKYKTVCQYPLGEFKYHYIEKLTSITDKDTLLDSIYGTIGSFEDANKLISTFQKVCNATPGTSINADAWGKDVDTLVEYSSHIITNDKYLHSLLTKE